MECNGVIELVRALPAHGAALFARGLRGDAPHLLDLHAFQTLIRILQRRTRRSVAQPLLPARCSPERHPGMRSHKESRLFSQTPGYVRIKKHKATERNRAPLQFARCNPEAPLKQILRKRCFNVSYEQLRAARGRVPRRGAAPRRCFESFALAPLVSCKPSATALRPELHYFPRAYSAEEKKEREEEEEVSAARVFPFAPREAPS